MAQFLKAKYLLSFSKIQVKFKRFYEGFFKKIIEFEIYIEIRVRNGNSSENFTPRGIKASRSGSYISKKTSLVA